MTHTPTTKGRRHLENEYDTLVLEEKENATFERVGFVRFELERSQNLFSLDYINVSLAGIERREIRLG